MDQFVGQIIAVGFNFAPEGWVLCNGQTLPISEYDTLFSLIGTTFGGDGQTTFAAPDLRGRSPLGQGTGAGLSSYFVGQSSGSENVTLSMDQTAAHTHEVMASIATGTVSTPSETVMIANQPNANFNVYALAPGDTNLAPAAVSPSTGDSQAHENRQPFNTVNYIISAVGIYPSQN